MKLKLQYFGHWCEELTHWKRPWCWERLKAGGEGDDRVWEGWMALPVMPKSRNLPMTTRELISDVKAREFLLPSWSWGSHQYRCSSYREEPWALDYIAYTKYYHAKNLKNGSLWVWLVTFWWRVRCWVLIGSPFPGWFKFPGLAKGSDWFAGGGVRSGAFQRLFSRNLTKWSSFDSLVGKIPWRSK